MKKSLRYPPPTTNHQPPTTNRFISAFTFVEILIAITLIAILAGAVFMGNIRSSYGKARDAKRKQDLVQLAKKMEDYYNDNQRYPAEDAANGIISGSPWGSRWPGYVEQLPTDPLSPTSDYYYQTNPYTQNFFAIYAKLETTDDPDIVRVGCSIGCGPDLSYNYVVTSPNVVMMAGIASTDAIYLTPATGPSPTPAAPPGSGCNFNQCGFCSKCGGIQDCGFLSRCWYENSQWLCKFDASCIL